MPKPIYLNPLFFFFSLFHSNSFQKPFLLSFCNPTMVKKCGGHSFRPRVRRSSPPPADSSNLGHPAAAVAALAAPYTVAAAAMPAPAAIQEIPTMGSDSAVDASAMRRYHTRVGPIPPPPPPICHILGHPGGPRRPRGPGHLTQESPPVLDPQSPNHHLLRALLKISL